MGKILNKTNIAQGLDVRAAHVTQSIDAFTGTVAYDITLSGSLNLTGSLLMTGSLIYEFSGQFKTLGLGVTAPSEPTMLHVKTSDSSNASKFVVNSPNIYLGLKFDKNLPTEPAVLGNEFDEWANELLDCIDGLMDDIIYNITYMSPTGPTGPMSSNESSLSLRRRQVKDLRSNIQYLKSKITKLS